MTTNQPVTVNVQTGAGEIVRLIATVLFFGGVGMLAWAVADGGYAELAGTGLSIMLVQIIKMLWSKGVITAPSKSGTDNFSETKGLMTRVAGEYKAWMARSGVLRMVLLAFGYALAFLVLRAGVTTALTVFQNVYIAGSVGAVVGAFIVAPSFLKTYTDPLKARGVLNPDALRTAEPAPAPVSTPTPVAPAPSQTPVSDLGADPTRRVVRRVVQNEGAKDA